MLDFWLDTFFFVMKGGGRGGRKGGGSRGGRAGERNREEGKGDLCFLHCLRSPNVNPGYWI